MSYARSLRRRAPVDPPPAESDAARLERHSQVLRELTALSLRVAQALGEKVLAEAAAPSAPTPAPASPQPATADPAPAAPNAAQLASAFARVTRAVHQSVALEAQLHARAKAAAAAGGDAKDPWPRGMAAPDPDFQRSVSLGFRLATVSELVGELIATVPGPNNRAQLREALEERLAAAEDDPAFLKRGVEQCIADVCHDLGLDPNTAVWSMDPEEDRAADAHDRPHRAPHTHRDDPALKPRPG